MKKLFAVLLIHFLFTSLGSAKALILIGEGENKYQSKLHELKIHSELMGSVLVQKYEFSFFNNGNSATEGELQCYLPNGARIVEFSMDVMGEKRDGVVVSANKAVEAYESIVRRRTDPGLIEIDEANQHFKMRVFPVESKQEKRVWITTVRLITAPTVDLQLEQLGEAKKVEASITIDHEYPPKNMNDWKFKKKNKHWVATYSGKRQSIPSCKLQVASHQKIFKYSSEGKTYFASAIAKSELKQKPYKGITQLWWDGSTKLTPQLLTRIQAWLAWKKEGKIELSIVRNTLTKHGEFSIKNGKCNALLKELNKVQPYGMARPSLLEWQGDHDGVVIVSDAKFAEGNKGIPEKLTYPLFAITENSQPNFLSALARNALTIIPENLTDRFSIEYQSHIIQTGVTHKAEEKDDSNATEHKIAYWLWAMNTAQLYKERDYPIKMLDAFHTKHKVAGDDYSWIVLENIFQHSQYNIRPPATKPEMVKEWLRYQDQQQHHKQYITSLKQSWKVHCDELSKEHPAYKETVMKFMKNNEERILSIPEKVLKLEAKQRKFYLEARNKIDPLTTEVQIHKALTDYVAKHRQYIKKLKVIWVTISGQVAKPGSKYFIIGTTIHEVVKQAKATEFAATNRVELRRNGRVYRYNLKNERHQKLKIYTNDQVHIPQVNWLGCGGSRGGHDQFKPQEKPTALIIKKEKLIWHESKPYLTILDKLNPKHEKAWIIQYLKQKKTYGWRADFYEDLICLLEDKKHMKLVNIVASDLAELDPENAEILRRAARTFYHFGELEIAQSLYLRLLKITPNKSIAHYDIARLYEKRKDYRNATKHFWQAVLTSFDSKNSGASIVYLEDLNACIHKGKIDPSNFDIPQALIRHIPVEARIILLNNSYQSTNISVHQKLLGYSSGLDWSFELSKWNWSGINRSHGTKSCSVRKLDPDSYDINAVFNFDSVTDSKSTATLTMELIRNFGSANETRVIISRRVKEGKRIKMLTLEKKP